jgi:dipeptidyl aminopeptidase/acylaminoacyl peptidase
MTTAAFGTWASPITPELVVTGARQLSELRAAGGAIFWLELRPDDGGRTAIVRRTQDGQVADVTPTGANVRTRVHEYGGGSYCVGEGVTFYVDFADQRVRRLDDGASQPRIITPEPEIPAALRYADFSLTPDGSHLICVRETHTGPAATDVVNEIVALPAEGGTALVLASGRDFYASPRLNPDGTQLAYVTWDHPAMPWDATEVVLVDLDGLSAGVARTVAGGPQESAILPAFAPDGSLHLISDRTGWWNLYALGAGGSLRNLAPVGLELGQPGWLLGQSLYGFLDDGSIAVVATDRAVERPSILDPATQKLTPISDHTACRDLVVASGDIWFVGASPTSFAEVVRCTGPGAPPEVVHRSRDLPVAPAWLPRPEAIAFPTGDGSETAHGFLYPPTNPEHDGPPGERPPLIVTSHGGPTASNPPALTLGIAYWTSRGFAVVDVNYRGSTGFGRSYRDALRDRWGVADVEDCAAAARFLAERGDVDGDRLLIRGGSASGYTTLCALAFTPTFTAGASYFGVADPALLAAETHKFESRYLDGLLGPYPAAQDVYEARSPLHHADDIAAPIILFQGLEDRVVPPAQSEAMAAALARNGVAHAYIPFAGEQHGFRDAANLIRCLEAELSFYAQVLGFPHPEGIPTVDLTG